MADQITVQANRRVRISVTRGTFGALAIREGVAYIAFAAIAVTLIDAEVAVSIITYEEHFGQDKQ